MGDTDVVSFCMKLPAELKAAATAEAKRRGLTLSAMIKVYLSSFLQKNIDMSRIIAEGNSEK